MATMSLTGPAVGAVSALSCALAWTVLNLVARNLAPYFSALSLNIVRSGVGGILLVPVALVAGDVGGLRHLSLLAWTYVILTVVAAVGVGDTAFFESAKTLGLARAMTISTSYPLVATALAVWLFDEPLTWLDAAGIVVTLGGLGLIVSEPQPGAPGASAERRRGLVLALICVCAWALSATFMKPPLREIDPLTIQAVRLPLTTLLLWATPWARGTGRTLWAHRRAVAGPVLALGALTAFSAVTFLAGLKYAGVGLGTLLSATSPLFALPIGFVAFGERVTWRAAIGAVLCIAGIGLLSL